MPISLKNEGFAISINEIPDIVVSDVIMPKLDGFEMLEKIKTSDLINHVPVILLTASAEGTSVARVLIARADDYITKPFKIDFLKLRIKNILKRQENLREKYASEIFRAQGNFNPAPDSFLDKKAGI